MPDKPKICAYCGEVYDSDRPKYCSDACKLKGKAERQYDGYKRDGVLNSNFRMLPLSFPEKTTCFGWDPERKECRILLETVCRHKKTCSFFKTKAQFERDRKTSELKLKIKYR